MARQARGVQVSEADRHQGVHVFFSTGQMAGKIVARALARLFRARVCFAAAPRKKGLQLHATAWSESRSCQPCMCIVVVAAQKPCEGAV